MRIAVALITHNRLDYTRRTLEAFNKTTLGAQTELVIVDNNSTDGTQDWLVENHGDERMILNRDNLFPGAATNIGWHEALKHLDADLLMRLDNDIELLPGWQRWVERAFRAIPRLGQLGLLNMHEDYPDGPPLEKWEENGAAIYLGNPGGVSVLRRELWDKGLRWACGGWQPGGRDEDSQMSDAVRNAGYIVGRLVPTVAENIAYHRYQDYPDYYQRTAALRGLVPETSV